MARKPIQSTVAAHGAGPADADERLGNELRSLMSHWPTGIAVLALKHRQQLEAITLNSLLSVSLRPPLVLVSIAERAPIRPALDATSRFSISILAADQARVASMTADRMPGLQRWFTDDDEPVVKDALAYLFCTTSQKHEAGDHILYIAQVQEIRLGRDAAALTYVNGTYARP